MDVPSFVIGGWGRLTVGMLCVLSATALIQVSRTLDFGLAAICWVPAAALLLVALGLVRRTRLRAEVGGFAIETGWLFRRAWTFRLRDARLELVPTAGLWAVVLILASGSRLTLATWLTRRRAEALGAWLDAVAGVPLPRQEAPRPEGDR